MPGEFDLIDRYFSHQQPASGAVDMSIGDDCAIVSVPHGMRLAITTDTLVAGTHFLPGADPGWIAHKALASNISDVAAMGGKPMWCSLALTLPELDDDWLAAFSQAFFALANAYGVTLIGGDTTKGPLSITITLHGLVPKHQALTRSGAHIGDHIYVTGALGDSKAGLDVILQAPTELSSLQQTLQQRHYLAEPRVIAGQHLLGLASAAVDISDGLVADLSHILQASGIGAQLELSCLPVSPALLAYVEQDLARAYRYALSSGEEYELCFTLPSEHQSQLVALGDKLGVPVTCIGQIVAGEGISMRIQGQPVDWSLSGYDHFKRNE